MCGIAGIFQAGGKVDRPNLEQMCSALAHRGPDDRGIYVDDVNGVGLAHARLSIIDLSPSGHQPMTAAQGAAWMVYNGEVYNFAGIRRELEQNGHGFFSSSDTEVVLKAYLQWDVEGFSRLNGMFAAAIWDLEKRRLLLIRDRVGVKPLYYYWDGRMLLFASELKALMAHRRFPKKINSVALAEYLKWGYVPAPWSIFENTFKLDAGHYLTIDCRNNLRREAYWRMPESAHAPYDSATENDTMDRLHSLLVSAFELRMVSDVPVGVFLSGGIDSSLVTAILAKDAGEHLKTFTIGFREADYDESVWAKKVSGHLGTEHHTFICTPDEARETIYRLPSIYDEPFADSSAIPTYMLAKYSRDFVKVILSADGGDEQFAGYRHHKRIMRIARLNVVSGALPFLRSVAMPCYRLKGINAAAGWLAERAGIKAFPDKMRKLDHMVAGRSIAEVHLAYLHYWYEEEIAALLDTRFPIDVKGAPSNGGNSLDAMLRADFRMGLTDDMLAKTDRACMAVGLENREPMLDYRLVEMAFSLPDEYKIRNGVSKYILKKILSRYLPDELIYRKKQGFIIPMHEWFRADLANLYQHYLSDGVLDGTGVFDKKVVSYYLRAYLDKGSVYSHKLWALLMFQMWWERWIKN